MSIYVFSLLVAYRRSGVDIAMGHRDRFLSKGNQPIRYIFTQVPTITYIEDYQHMGISPENMLCAHSFLAGRETLGGDCPVSEILPELQKRYEIDHTVCVDSTIHLYKNQSLKVSIKLKDNPEYFSGIWYFDKGRLITAEVYTDRLLYTNYFETVDDERGRRARLARTAFSDEQGRRVYECLYDRKETPTYVFPNGQTYTHAELMELFIKKLSLTEKDMVLIDRPSHLDYVQPLFEHGTKAQLIAFLHSGHYYEKGEAPSAVYMNYEYYYWFKYSHKLDYILVSTEEQKKELTDKLREYGCHVPQIEVIPISGLERLKYPQGDRKRYSILTVSRMDACKRIDMVIRSVAEAHKQLPEITLDIYGDGPADYTDMCKQLVQELQAEEYIRFMGQCDVQEVYQNYELYLTASMMETLGLSVMEAIGAGNAVVGLDVRYGNRMFVKPGQNGQLVEFSMENANVPKKEQETIRKMADAIVDTLSDCERLKSYSEESYRIAKDYMNDTIGEKWIQFIRKVNRYGL